MKPSNRLVVAGISLSFLFFASCKKQIDEPVAKDSLSQPSIIPSTSCKPAIYGMYQTNTGEWTTIAQKWSAGGKVKYLKTHYSGRPEELIGLFNAEPLLNIDWGEVTYEGNQVRVWDVPNNRLVFRATLDGSGKPVASYLYNQTIAPNGDTRMFIDTSYYYYENDRLQSIIQIFQKLANGAVATSFWEQYFLTYNASGNLTSYFARHEEAVTEFTYGAGVSGNVSDYVLTTSFRMLEFLEIASLPMNATLLQTRMIRLHEGIPPFTVYSKQFNNYDITDGLVRSFQHPNLSGGSRNFYVGWGCGGSASTGPVNRQSSIIRNLGQFKELYSGK